MDRVAECTISNPGRTEAVSLTELATIKSSTSSPLTSKDDIPKGVFPAPYSTVAEKVQYTIFVQICHSDSY